MVWFVLLHLVGLIVALLAGARGKADEKELQIALLRHQVRLLQRRSPRPPHLARWEKLTLAALTARLVRLTNRPRTQLAQILLLVQPETVLKWHRELVRRKWTYRRRLASGRPPVSPDIAALLLRLATEHPRWGYGRLQGELPKLGHALGRSTIRDMLQRRRVPPAPRCGSHATSWPQFLAQHRDAVLACDFFTVETVFLKTITVLFFREMHPPGASRGLYRPVLGLYTCGTIRMDKEPGQGAVGTRHRTPPWVEAQSSSVRRKGSPALSMLKVLPLGYRPK